MNYQQEELRISEGTKIETSLFDGDVFGFEVPELSSITGLAAVSGEPHPRIIIETSPSNKTKTLIIGVLKTGKTTTISPQLRKLLGTYVISYHHSNFRTICSVFEILDPQVTNS